jgi:hypothetical protein
MFQNTFKPYTYTITIIWPNQNLFFFFIVLKNCVTFIIGPTNVEYLRWSYKNILKNIELNVFDDIVWLWPNLIGYS